MEEEAREELGCMDTLTKLAGHVEVGQSMSCVRSEHDHDTCLHASHFYLLVMYPMTKTVHIYDSLREDGPRQQLKDMYKKYINVVTIIIPLAIRHHLEERPSRAILRWILGRSK